MITEDKFRKYVEVQIEGKYSDGSEGIIDILELFSSWKLIK